MDGHIFACKIDELNGTPKVIELPNNNNEIRQIGIFNVDNTLYAIDNLCAHERAQLNFGDIEDLPLLLTENERQDTSACVMCPKHRSKFCGGLYFNLASGRALTKAPTKNLDPSWKLATYDVKQVDGNVFVSTVPNNGAAPLAGLKRDPWATVTLTNIERYNHDSFYYDFQLDVVTRDMVQNGSFKNKKEKKILKKKGQNVQSNTF